MPRLRCQEVVRRAVVRPLAVVFFAAARLAVAAGFFAAGCLAVLLRAVALGLAAFLGVLPFAAPVLSLARAVPAALAAGFGLAAGSAPGTY